MKRILSLLTAAALLAALGACAPRETDPPQEADDATLIGLYDNGVQVDGGPAPSGPDSGAAVYVDNDIIFYLADQGPYYGAGTAADEHTQAEADAHTVVHITQPGTYRLTGTLSAGQIFVDLGEGAKEDPGAVVTLILDNAHVTCTVAPAVFFYAVYECGDDTLDTGGVVDTSAAGANVLLADGTENTVNGAYVARIYRSYELAEDGVTVADSKKLHKYDGAFYSRMSMNVSGGPEGTGALTIQAENEGLDSELHLTINGGNITIQAQDDGINTNEDGISVTTLNGGTLTVHGGLGAEGDGIDSNGYLTINGGTLIATANGRTGDGGIDAERDILLNGGTVIALGSRNDQVSPASGQLELELTFSSAPQGGSVLALTDEAGQVLADYTAQRVYQSATLSLPALRQDTVYHVTVDGVLQQYTGHQSPGFPGGPMPGGMEPPEGMELPEGMEPPEGMELPEGMEPPAGAAGPQGGEPPALPQGPGEMSRPDGGQPPQGGGQPGAGQRPGGNDQEAPAQAGETDFVLADSQSAFSGLSAAQ